MSTETACRQCGESKPASGFYSSNQSRCKECVKESVRSNRAAHLDHYREYDRARASDPTRVAARAAYADTEAGQAAVARAKVAYRRRHQDRETAKTAVNNAVRDGRLQPLPCEVCGCTKSEAHHPSYEMPLVVTWLCGPHHKQLHKEHRELLRTSQKNLPAP